MQGLIRTALIALMVALVAGCAEDLTAEQHLQRAEALQSEGKLAEARIELRHAIQQNPNFAPARLLMGEIQLGLGDDAAAMREFERALDLGVEGERLTLGLNRTKVRVGRHNEVLGDLAQREDLSPALAVVLGEAFLAAGDLENAQANFEKGRTLAAGLSGLGVVAAEQGDLATARSRFEEAVKLDPRDTEAWLRQGNLAALEGRFADAEAAYQGAIGTPGGELMGRFGLARVKLAADKADEAAEAIGAVLVAAPEFAAAHYLQATIRVRQGDLERARKAIDRTRELAPDYPQTDYLLAAIEYQSGNHDAAEKAIERFLKHDPQNAEGLKLLASLLIERGDFAGAAAQLADVSRSSRDAQLLAVYGTAQLRLGNAAAASEAFARAVELAPDTSQFRNQLAFSLMAAGDSTRAEEALTAEVDIGGGQFERDYLLAMVHLQQKDWQAADAVIERLASADPQSPIPHQLRATSQAMQGTGDRGEAEYRAALAKDPTYLPAVQGLAELAEARGDSAGARKLFEEVVQRDANNAGALTVLGEYALRGGDRDGALGYFERAVAADPAAVPANLALARLLVASQQLREAARVVGAALERAPEQPDLLALQADLGLALGDAEASADALGLLQQRASRDPDNARLQLVVGALQQRLGETAAARASLERALKGDPEVASQARVNLARLALGQNDAAAARSHLTALQQAGAQGEDLDLLKADVLLVEGKSDEAAAAYEALMGKGVREAFLRRAAQLMASGQTAPAVATLERWLNQHAEDDGARLLLANMLMQTNPKEAILHYQQLEDSGNAVALNNLAWLYMEDGDARALPTARKALAAAPDDPDVLDTVGWILHQSGNRAEALPLLKRSAEMRPDNPSILYHLGIALRDSGDRAGARRTLERALGLQAFPEAGEAREVLDQLAASP